MKQKSYKHKKHLIVFILGGCFWLQSKSIHQETFLGKKNMSTSVSTEKTPSMLSFLYTNSIGKMMRSCLIKPWASSLAGWFCNRSISSWWIPSFVKSNHIDMSEAQKPAKAYRTFNEFFIRELKSDARPIDPDPTIIISPADGTIFVMENITQSMNFPVKESTFNLTAFLGDAALAHTYEGGTLVLLRLAPWDYHRFHFPASCIPDKARHIKGSYESVNPIAYLCGIQPLTENERHLTLLKTTDFDTVCMISVGALFVGAIKETYIPQKKYNKGEEAGYFCFGGSTIVLVFKKNVVAINPLYINNSNQGKETPLKMGIPIGYKLPNVHSKKRPA